MPEHSTQCPNARLLKSGYKCIQIAGKTKKVRNSYALKPLGMIYPRYCCPKHKRFVQKFSKFARLGGILQPVRLSYPTDRSIDYQKNIYIVLLITTTLLGLKLACNISISWKLLSRSKRGEPTSYLGHSNIDRIVQD